MHADDFDALLEFSDSKIHHIILFTNHDQLSALMIWEIKFGVRPSVIYIYFNTDNIAWYISKEIKFDN
jgi:hypothetical protein